MKSILIEFHKWAGFHRHPVRSGKARTLGYITIVFCEGSLLDLVTHLSKKAVGAE